MKKIKIEITTFAGTVLFKYTCNDNSVKKTLVKAVSTGAYLTGANLRGANLTRAYNEKIVIEKATVITGLYKYIVMPIIAENGKQYVIMGCYTRTVKEWNQDFWNNTSEFPNDKSLKSQLRVMAYKTAKQWIKLNLDN